MPRAAMLFGAVLLALAWAGYLLSGCDLGSSDVLVPGVPGALLVVLGVVGFLAKSWRRHAMHAAALLSLVGAIPGVVRLVKLIVEKPSLVLHSLTSLACAVFLGLSLKSFLDARRLRRLESKVEKLRMPQ